MNNVPTGLVKFLAGVGVASIVIWAYKKYAMKQTPEPIKMVLPPVKTTTPQQ